MTVRTRLAPSPTGLVHIGNIRVGIYNYLFAKHHDGKFLLRVEDTDLKRSTQAATNTLLEILDWLSLQPDEEIVYQSKNLDRHLEAAEQLLQKGFCYRGVGQKEGCIVFRLPERDLEFHDEIRGKLTKPQEQDDLVIVRSDGTPTFHLANVVDDIDMGITHVIRGDDHIENTYRHVELFKALGAPLPKYIHLPMITNHRGKPYSKRDGDAYVGDFRKKGFLPDVLFNFLALLGWSPGDNREILSRDEMVAAFSFNGINISPSQMDHKKLAWMNGEYIRAMSEDQFFLNAWAAFNNAGITFNDSVSARKALRTMQVRTKTFPSLVDDAAFFFIDDFTFDPKAVKKRLTPEILPILKVFADTLVWITEFTSQNIEETLRTVAANEKIKPASLIHATRIAVSGLPKGPSLFEMLSILGKEKVVARLNARIT